MRKAVMMRNGIGCHLGTNAWRHLPNLDLRFVINPSNRLPLLVIVGLLQLTFHVFGVEQELAFLGFRRAVGALPHALLFQPIDKRADVPPRLPVMNSKQSIAPSIHSIITSV